MTTPSDRDATFYKLPNGVRIPNIVALNDVIADGNQGFAIALQRGLISVKTISRANGKYLVENHIDGSEQLLSEEELLDVGRTNIARAMQEGALFTHNG